ncbi:MAG: hypothetical protein FWJ93_07930 [Micromonosporaceae bacterium]
MDGDWPESYLVLVIGPVPGPDDLPDLCARIDEARDGLPRGGSLVVLCDVGAVVRPDLAALNHLARLRLHTVRVGGTLRLWRAGPRLRLLLELTGLRAVLPSHPCQPGPIGLPDELGRLTAQQHGGQPEQREQPLGIQEIVDPDDPSA